jgi:uncharacterized small protein (DUF1192 family)
MALETDEDLPRHKKPAPRDLSRMSVEELRDYVTELQAEITRVEAAIAAKRSVRDQADALFKRPQG